MVLDVLIKMKTRIYAAPGVIGLIVGHAIGRINISRCEWFSVISESVNLS